MRPPTRLGGGRGTLPLLSPKQASVPERQTKNPACRRIRPSLSRLCWRDDRTGACTHALNLLGIQSSDFNAPSAAAFGIAVEALLLVIVETSRYSTPSRRRACCRRCDVEVGATDGGRGWRRGLASRCGAEGTDFASNGGHIAARPSARSCRYRSCRTRRSAIIVHTRCSDSQGIWEMSAISAAQSRL